MPRALEQLHRRLEQAKLPAVDVPDCSFLEFLARHARVRLPDGRYVPYTFEGRDALRFVAELIDKIIRNTLGKQTVEIDGIAYKPGALKGAAVSVCGGAQFGKTVLELNFGGWCTTVRFANFGYYTSDLALLSTIVDTKFRPDVVDQIPWMPAMISLNKTETRGGRTVNRKNAFQVSNGERKAFGYFNGMQRPPTTISLDIAVLDEVDDIPARNIGFVAGRMTNSDVQLTCFIGTQRIHAAGQNSRWLAGTMHKRMCTCPACRAAYNLPEHWPGVTRMAIDGRRDPADPRLDETMQFDPDAVYYPACPQCGAPLDRDTAAYEAEHPERARFRNWSIRISQMDVPAIPWRDIVARWFAALRDPNPAAIAAWWCDVAAIPVAGAAQPIVPSVLQRARNTGLMELVPNDFLPRPYAMSLARQGCPRVVGMDTGPRCWMWMQDVRSPRLQSLSWAEMVPSGRAFARCTELFHAGLIDCIFIDAGGEPDLTKRIVLALNGLDAYQPPFMPAAELRNAHLHNIGNGLTWDGAQGRWSGLKAAAVLFSLRPGGGVQHDVEFTQDGRIYPLVKCNRAESIQGFVNFFLTPQEGVIQIVDDELRTLPLQRLPETAIGPGVTNNVLDTHLSNLRRGKKPGSLQEDWLDGLENHLGLAGVYARLAAQVVQAAPVAHFEYSRVPRSRAAAARARGKVAMA